MSAFDAQQDGDAAGGARVHECRQPFVASDKVLRVKLDLAVNGGDLIERPLDGRRAR